MPLQKSHLSQQEDGVGLNEEHRSFSEEEDHTWDFPGFKKKRKIQGETLAVLGVLATKGEQKRERQGCQASGAVKKLRIKSCKLTKRLTLSGAATFSILLSMNLLTAANNGSLACSCQNCVFSFEIRMPILLFFFQILVHNSFTFKTISPDPTSCFLQHYISFFAPLELLIIQEITTLIFIRCLHMLHWSEFKTQFLVYENIHIDPLNWNVYRKTVVCIIISIPVNCFYKIICIIFFFLLGLGS